MNKYIYTLCLVAFMGSVLIGCQDHSNRENIKEIILLSYKNGYYRGKLDERNHENHLKEDSLMMVKQVDSIYK